MTHMAHRATKTKRYVIIIGVVVAVGLISGVLYWHSAQDNQAKPEPVSQQSSPEQPPPTEAQEVLQTPSTATPPPEQAVAPPKQPSWPEQISLADASSLTVVVNKKHQLPSSYVPQSVQSYSGIQ